MFFFNVFLFLCLISCCLSQSSFNSTNPSARNGDLAQALHIAFARIIAHRNFMPPLEQTVLSSTLESANSLLLRTSFIADAWPPFEQPQYQTDVTTLPLPTAGVGSSTTTTSTSTTVLGKILNLNKLLVSSFCIDLGTYNATNGMNPPGGYRGQQYYSAVQEFGAMYGVSNFTLEFLCSGQLNQVFTALLNGTGDMLDPVFVLGGVALNIRRALLARPGASSYVNSDTFQILTSRNITNFQQIVNALNSNSILATNGAGSRQILQSLFPQVPPNQVIDFGSSNALTAVVENGTALVGFDELPSGNVPLVQFQAGTLTLDSWFTRYDYTPNVRNPAGYEALAEALESAWANAASNGARKLALSLTPDAGFPIDAIPEPSTLPFPSPVGILNRILSTHNVTIGELRNVQLPPWYTPGAADGVAPTGSHASMWTVLFNTMSVYYALSPGISVTWRYYDTVEGLFGALDSGEIDVAGGLAGQGNFVNGTLDYVQYRRLVSTFAIPLNLYMRSGLSALYSGQAIFNLWDLYMNASAAATAPTYTVGIPYPFYESVMAYTLVFGNSRMRVVNCSGRDDVVQQLSNNAIDFGFMEEYQAATDAGLAYAVVAYRPIVPFVLNDPPIQSNPPVVKYVRWSNAASIVVLCVAALLVLAVLLVAALFVYYHDTSIVVNSQLHFCFVTMLGLLLGLAVVLTYIGYLSEAQCALRPWLGGLAFVLVFAPLLAKLSRLSRIMSNTGLVVTVIKTTELVLYIAAIVGVELVLLVVWTTVGRLKPVARNSVTQTLQQAAAACNPQSGADQSTEIVQDQVIVCTSGPSLWIFLALQLAYVVVLLLVGIYLSIRVRKIGSRVLYGEPKWITFAIYNVVFWVIFFCLVSAFLWNNWLGGFITEMVTILGMCIGTFVLLFAPKLRVLFLTRDGRESTVNTTSKRSTFGESSPGSNKNPSQGYTTGFTPTDIPADY